MRYELAFDAETFQGETGSDEFGWSEMEAPGAPYARAGGVEPYCPEYRIWVQQSLNRLLGLRLAVDGQLGPQSREAIKSFQRRAGIKDHGIVNEETEAALRKAGAPTPPISFPPPPPAAPGAAQTPTWIRALVPLLERYRGDIPLDFLVGWIAVESAGCVGVITQPELDERGYFQIHKEERKLLKVDGQPVDSQRVASEPEYSVRAGIELVRYYMRRAENHLKINRGTALFLPMVKFQHAGIGYVDAVLGAMRSDGVPPTSWEAIRNYVRNNTAKLRQHKFFIRRDPNTLIHNVDETIRKGQLLTPRQAGGQRLELDLEAVPFGGYAELDEFESFDGEFEFEGEWLGEVSRSSPEYGRWIQQSLNQVSGLRLAVDGIIGSQTRSAVSSFQQRAGLAADGVVGPQTEAALVRAGASPPPGSAASQDGGFFSSISSGLSSAYDTASSYLSGLIPSSPWGGSTAGVGTAPALASVPGIEKTSQAFRDKVVRIASDIGTDPNYLLAIMSFESGGTFSPSVKNPYSGATGLIQFMPSTARNLGTSVEALAAMSAEQQLDYVSKYFAPYRGRLKTLEDAYMAVLWPKAIGKGNSYVLFSTPSTAYQQNSALDSNRDGKITVAEAASKVRQRLGSTAAPAAPSAAAPSPASAAGINTQMPQFGPGFYSYSTPSKSYGLPKTIQALLTISAAWERANPGGPQIGFGNISYKGGGPFPPHSSHQKGIDVDIRPMRKDGKKESVVYQSPDYSRALTQQLVNLIRSNGILPVRTILFNDPGVTGVSAYTGHDNHLHVSFIAA
jgi:peptidoglycan hydrolase-like protein with peptidoglycan-binding domain